MSDCLNENKVVVHFGGDFKVNVHFDPIEDTGMDDVDFRCTFYVKSDRSVKVEKKDMIRIDSGNFVACMNSEKLSRGAVMMRIEADFPDTDFATGIRKEVEVVYTGIVIK